MGQTNFNTYVWLTRCTVPGQAAHMLRKIIKTSDQINKQHDAGFVDVGNYIDTCTGIPTAVSPTLDMLKYEQLHCA